MRQLKHHEKKLLRKVDLFSWKKEDNLRVAQVLRRYHVQDKNDYIAYNRICGMIGKLSAKLKVRFSFSIERVHGSRMKVSGGIWDLMRCAVQSHQNEAFACLKWIYLTFF